MRNNDLVRSTFIGRLSRDSSWGAFRHKQPASGMLLLILRFPSFAHLKNKTRGPTPLEKLLRESEQAQWVVKSSERLRKGFFVDLAANHPEELSNTVWLERALGWRGICIEAAEQYVALLREKRSCTVVASPIDSVVHEISFDTSRGAEGGIVAVRPSMILSPRKRVHFPRPPSPTARTAHPRTPL